MKQMETAKDNLCKMQLEEQQRKFDMKLKATLDEHQKRLMFKEHEGETTLSMYEEKEEENKGLKENLKLITADAAEWHSRYDEGVVLLEKALDKQQATEKKVKELTEIVSEKEMKITKYKEDLNLASDELEAKTNDGK